MTTMPMLLALMASDHVAVVLSDIPSVMTTRKLVTFALSPLAEVNIWSTAVLIMQCQLYHYITNPLKRPFQLDIGYIAIIVSENDAHS